jgi:hypothetical protein
MASTVLVHPVALLLCLMSLSLLVLSAWVGRPDRRQRFSVDFSRKVPAPLAGLRPRRDLPAVRALYASCAEDYAHRFRKALRQIGG